MGQYLSAAIMYGYPLGGDDGEGFTCYPADDDTYETKWPAWVALEEDGDPDDFITQAGDRLITVLGNFTEPQPEVDWEDADYRKSPGYKALDGWYNRQRAARVAANLDDGIGSLKFESGGVSDYSIWVLGFQILDVSGSLSEIDPAIDSLMPEENRAHWDAALARAVEALEIEPKDADGDALTSPRLYVTVSYG